MYTNYKQIPVWPGLYIALSVCMNTDELFSTYVTFFVSVNDSPPDPVIFRSSSFFFNEPDSKFILFGTWNEGKHGNQLQLILKKTKMNYESFRVSAVINDNKLANWQKMYIVCDVICYYLLFLLFVFVGFFLSFLFFVRFFIFVFY